MLKYCDEYENDNRKCGVCDKIMKYLHKDYRSISEYHHEKLNCSNCDKNIDMHRGYYHCSEECGTNYHGKDDQKACLEKFNTFKCSKTELVNQTGLGRIFSERFGIKDPPQDKEKKKKFVNYWRGLYYIQNIVKSKIGCGSPIEVNYFASVDLKNPLKDLTYEYNHLGDDFDLLKNGDEETYCLKQTIKMCFYIQKNYHIDILRMKCLF